MITRPKTFLKTCLHFCVVASSPLNIKLFLTVQMVLHIMIIISMKKEALSWALKASTIWNGPCDWGTVIPTKLQQSYAKSQCRNKWSTASSTKLLHKTQLKDCKCIFFLLKMFPVLSLSFVSSPKNTLRLAGRTTSKSNWKPDAPVLNQKAACKLLHTRNSSLPKCKTKYHWIQKVGSCSLSLPAEGTVDKLLPTVANGNFGLGTGWTWQLQVSYLGS